MTAQCPVDGRAYLARLRAQLTDFDGISEDDGTRFFLPHTPSLDERRALRAEGRDWPLRADTMIGLRRLEQFQTAIEIAIADGIPGDIMEAGVWRGGACILARATLRVLESHDRTVWLADSFAGLPPPDERRFPADQGDRHHTEPFLCVSRQEVEANFLKYGLLDDQVRFLEGWFSNTLPSAPVEQLSVLRLDGDMYQSTMVALQSLYDRVSPGGFVIVDDYGAIAACRAAVDDFRRERAITAALIPIDWTGHYWRVPTREPRHGWMSADANAAPGWDLWNGFKSDAAERLTGRARAAFDAGDFSQAEDLARQALAADGNALPAHLLLSEARYPGPCYLAHLAWMHDTFRPRVYLEIGVFKGDSITLAMPECRAIGIDPRPLISAADNFTLVMKTSDEFFTSGEADRLLAPSGFDLAFLDGCHLFEQILRDFLHVERYAAPGARLVLHDTVPLDEVTASRRRTTTFYSGDAWKLLAVLHDLRPDLLVRTLPCAPTGLTIVERMDPRSDVLASRYSEVAERYSALSWADYVASRLRISNFLCNQLGALAR